METQKIMKKMAMIFVVQLIFLVSIFSVSALTIRNVDTNPNQVEPGKSVSVLIELANNLDKDVTNVEISLILTSAMAGNNPLNPIVYQELPFSPKESSEEFIDEIKEDDEETVEFNLIVDGDADAGTYKIPVLLSYLVNGDVIRTEKYATISLTINAEPNLVLSSENILLKERKNTLDVKITNSGLGKAKLLEVELVESGAYDILSSSKVYIGDLDSDDFDVASFDIFTKTSSPANFQLELKYRDSTNKIFTKTVIVSAKVYSTEEAESVGLLQKSNARLYFYIIVVLLVLWFVWRKWKKRRAKRR